MISVPSLTEQVSKHANDPNILNFDGDDINPDCTIIFLPVLNSSRLLVGRFLTGMPWS